jgi:DNA-binding response OmpR family regulator
MAQGDPVPLRIAYVQRPARAVDDRHLVARELAFDLPARTWIDPKRQQVKPGRVVSKSLDQRVAGARLERQKPAAGNVEPDRPECSIFPVIPDLLRQPDHAAIERHHPLEVPHLDGKVVEALNAHGRMLCSPFRVMARLLIVEDHSELAALVATAARLRGHTPICFPSGANAIAAVQGHGERFDGAVVDLLLPDVRGSEVLRALRRQGIPIFAVSGIYKGHRFAREAVELHGARGYFEKPFDVGDLLDAFEEALRAADGDEPPLAGAPEPIDPPAEYVSLVGVGKFGPIEPGTVPHLLNACYQGRHVGKLQLRLGQVTKVVHFEDGQLTYAASNLSQERFGSFCGRRSLLAGSDLPAVAALTREQNLGTGEAMVHLGLITPEQRRRLLVDQINEIVWSTFEWTAGEYVFAERSPPRPRRVKLAVFPGNLILGGARQLPLVVLRRKMSPERRLFPNSHPPYALHDITLSGAHARLLAWADGTKSVEDLLALSDLPERDVLGTLYGFELLRLIEERRAETRGRRISFGI